jgi:hypothetical protein
MVEYRAIYELVLAAFSRTMGFHTASTDCRRSAAIVERQLGFKADFDGAFRERRVRFESRRSTLCVSRMSACHDHRPTLSTRCCLSLLQMGDVKPVIRLPAEPGCRAPRRCLPSPPRS